MIALGTMAVSLVNRAATAAVRVLATFDQPDSMDSWKTVNDGVMGGVSEGGCKRTDSNTLRFSGTISLENHGGFASIRTEPRAMDLTGLTALADSRDVANLFRKSLEIGLPPLAVSVGDTWTADETMTFPQAGDTHVEMNGKFEGIEERDGRKHAKIAFEGKLSSVTRKDKPVANIEIGQGSTMSGIIFYDIERRTTSLSSYNNHLKLIVAGQEVPFDQHITSKMLSIEDSK